jgi:hypothetical protein
VPRIYLQGNFQGTPIIQDDKIMLLQIKSLLKKIWDQNFQLFFISYLNYTCESKKFIVFNGLSFGFDHQQKMFFKSITRSTKNIIRSGNPNP